MIFALLFVFNIFAANNLSVKTETLYSELLNSEQATSSSKDALNTFLTKIDTIKDCRCKKTAKNNVCKISGEYSKRELVILLGQIHNVLMDYFYSQNPKSPVATSFTEAIDKNHTPDSQHYAALVASALLSKGVSVTFFKTPTLTGLYFGEGVADMELYWCVLTPLAKRPAASKAEYVELFNKFKNSKLNGIDKIKESDIYYMDSYDFKFSYSKKSKISDSATVVANEPERTMDKIIDLEEETSKPVDPVIGTDAISAYEGSVDLFDKDGRIYASNKLRDQIKYESVKNITQIKKCAFDNSIKDKRVILKYVIGKDGKIANMELDNIDSPKFKACIEPVASSFGISKDFVSTDVKVMQIIKL